jgi:hypothetical protein
VKKFLLAVAVAAVASMGIVSSASAGVERYQMQTLTITAVQPEGAVGQFLNVWTHTYEVTLNPCDGSFVGDGSVSGTLGGFLSDEMITGNIVGDKVSFTATRNLDGLEYSLTDAPLDNTTVTVATSEPVAPWVLEFKVDATTPIATTEYKNHGDYVNQAGDKADAAHSCIGMPIH